MDEQSNIAGQYGIRSIPTLLFFQNGEVVLRIEPMQRAMKWKEFDRDGTPVPETKKTEVKKSEAKKEG